MHWLDNPHVKTIIALTGGTLLLWLVVVTMPWSFFLFGFIFVYCVLYTLVNHAQADHL